MGVTPYRETIDRTRRLLGNDTIIAINICVWLVSTLFMRLVRFRDQAGYIRQGNWTNQGIEYSGKVYDPQETEILPPVEPSKIVGVGRNYYPAEDDDPQYPEFPRTFFKPPHTVVGHGKTVKIPLNDADVLYEAEVGIVIGRQCKNTSKENVEDFIKGYTCVNDLTHLIDRSEDPYGVRIKAFDNAAPMGPVMASPEHVPEDASIELRLNGETKQSSTFAETIYSTGEIIEKITQYITLEPNDVVLTGSPPGLGPVDDGDTVEIEIEGIGTLQHDVESW